ncbi:MAG: hypothetical protein QG608_3208 [Actinomycetota bacterium]|nr:hypothetical protein [Actinomycetota bacterium]
MRRSPVLLSLVACLLLVTTTGCDPDSDRRPASRIEVPDLVGLRLGEAEKKLAALDLFDRARDASGLGRTVVNPSNWVVSAQSPGAGKHAPDNRFVTLQVLKPTDEAAARLRPRSGDKGVVPKVVCLGLDRAKDELKAAGFRNLDSQDGTGEKRRQWISRNWLVISQSQAPGSRPDTDTEIVLKVVKFGEPTGSSGCRS